MMHKHSAIQCKNTVPYNCFKKFISKTYHHFIGIDFSVIIPEIELLEEDFSLSFSLAVVLGAVIRVYIE